MDYSKLSVSNGSGDAALMHITAERLVGSVTISVDSVVNVPAKFIGTYGTPASSVLIDPTTKRDFLGHLSGSDLIIDSFLDGSVDNGNVEGQIVVIKPNSPHTNAMVTLAKVAHNDDGTIKSSLLGALWPVGSVYINTQATNPATLLGFGTWSAFAAGQVLVGKGTGTFATAGASVGAETVNLAHSHTANDHIHGRSTQASGAPNQNHTHNGGNGTGNATNGFNSSWTHNYERTDGGSTDRGMDSQLSSAQSVVQPSLVVYMWTRTA